MCNGTDHGASEMNHQQHTKGRFSPKEGDAMCVDWKGVLYYDLLLENQAFNSNKYCSHLDQLKAALDEKWPDLVNRKHITFHQNNARPHVSLMNRQNCLAGKFWFICCIHQTWHIRVCIYFGLYKIHLMEKYFNSLKTVKGSWNCVEKDRRFWEDEITKLPEKMAEGSGTKQWIHCSIKFLVKMNDMLFIFT